ncbi:hypothetical protein ACRALDRAFT_1094327, partial [Sodiomyces alcalophilus JCM 7366]|uniref:uncharacterized protein n=1 Tax=Sodiomyces alcalophilus JCM 7366 TaxID=591952 RepID=UPI0039B6B017
MPKWFCDSAQHHTPLAPGLVQQDKDRPLKNCTQSITDSSLLLSPPRSTSPSSGLKTQGRGAGHYQSAVVISAPNKLLHKMISVTGAPVNFAPYKDWDSIPGFDTSQTHVIASEQVRRLLLAHAGNTSKVKESITIAINHTRVTEYDL